MSKIKDIKLWEHERDIDKYLILLATFMTGYLHHEDILLRETAIKYAFLGLVIAIIMSIVNYGLVWFYFYQNQENANLKKWADWTWWISLMFFLVSFIYILGIITIRVFTT